MKSISPQNNPLQGILELLVILCVSIPIAIVIGVLFSNLYTQGALTTNLILTSIVLFLSIVLTGQGLFTLFWMLYAWEDPNEVNSHASPKQFENPHYSFSALIPARNEENVIKDTILAIDRIDYPDELKEVIILCRIDDEKTIYKAQEIINKLGKRNIRLEIGNGFPINKPRSLNLGLYSAKNQIVTIFDAEDEPHVDIYKIINTVLVKEEVDVVQAGVQLMNFRSSWFATLNCLEYYFWFKSGLHFFSKVGQVTPLGGNTVFFKKEFLYKIGGWDEYCLTEDADIGIRLIQAGAKIRVVYDEQHATQEETPDTLASLIKQRTRWNQGFLQVFFKYHWAHLPKLRQKITSWYVLLSPIFQALLFLYTPVAIALAIYTKLPLLVSLLSFIPLTLFALQVITLAIGLHKFAKAYKLSAPPWVYSKIIITFYPYQFILMISAIRALYRFIFSLNTWEKTEHINAHRKS